VTQLVGLLYWGHGYPDVALLLMPAFPDDAHGLIEVDDDVVAKASAWLATQQAADGSWPSHYY